MGQLQKGKIKMSKRGHIIKEVDSGSIADQLELEPGDTVLSIDGHELEDIFDYEYYINSESILMTVKKKDGEEWELEIENQYEDLGITFENGLMSEYRSCRNKCIFCFIDQMPPGMRETLYFKDDDSRLSFLQGNYVTLTNMSDHDIDRIIKFKLAPINISVHTTNPALRCEMLHNRFAGKALDKIQRLYEAEIPMNGQIVLCKGVNDGKELERTIEDLSKYLPYMESVSAVPVGMSKYRDGLYPLQPFTSEDAKEIVKIIGRWQKQLYKTHGNHFIHASDELYILAGLPFPEENCYDGYIQLENGVGMLRLLDEEIKSALETMEDDHKSEEISIATGRLAAPYIERHAKLIREKFPGRVIHIYPITNVFFGEQITVAGLITGQDLIGQLKGKVLGRRLLLPECMFRSGEEVFLDDLTRQDVQNALQVQVDIVKSSGQDFVQAVLEPVEESEASYEGYELNTLSGIPL
jgi:putative radical SAM enzyme (TIGR03279 family)